MIIFNEKNEALSPFKTEEGIEYFRLEEGVYRFATKMAEAREIWTPLCIRDHLMRQWWNPNINDSKFQYGSPVMTTVDGEGNNVVTAALSDTVKTARMTFSVDDLSQKDELLYRIELQKDGVFQTDEKCVILRVDRRKIPYYQAIKEAGAFMRENLKFSAKIPEYAQLPLYSSWYNFHQDPDQKLLTEELDMASKMGFKTVILDDGWQIEGGGTGDYFKCGDWHVAEDKFPDFKAFADHVHEIGMKLIMWFPVPFVGYATEDYKKWESRLAQKVDGIRAGVLDVRYKACRDYIIGIYETFAEKYGIDGLKLDFIDSFNVPAEILPPYNEEMDHESMITAVRTLMDEIYGALTAIDPDFLFEYREWYVGAEMVNHANMLRVCDCAYDSATNRIGIATLRMLDPETAIHSDMLLWSRDETCENVARQLLDVMFSVPQISVLLTRSTEDQKRVVESFVKYWMENRDIILHGTFEPGIPDYNYEIIAAEKDGKRISVLYGTNSFELKGVDEDVFNSTAKKYVLAGEPQDGAFDGSKYTYRVYDLFGEISDEGGTLGAKRQFDVPTGGRLSIRRKDQ